MSTGSSNTPERTDPTERVRAELGPIAAIAKALTSMLEEDELFERIAQQIERWVHPSRWSLVLTDKDGAHHRVGGSCGEGPRASQAELVGRPGPVPALAVSLHTRGRKLGALEIEGELSTGDLALVQAIADFAAIGIENARALRSMKELSITDEHTGLFNARHLNDVLAHEVARAARFARPVTLVFIDLDNFKTVNDAHGHLAGSRVLADVGALLRASIRRVDSAFRYGGDEFALILVETGIDEGIRISQRIRDRLQSALFLREVGEGVRLTASFGVATYPDHAATHADLLQAADHAMYRAKALGRDRIVSTRSPA